MGADLAGFGPRIGAGLLDLVPVVLVAVLVGQLAGIDREDASYLVVVAALVTNLLYGPLFMSRAGTRNGQTPGKQLMHVRVVRADASPMTLSPALVREFIGKGVLGLIPFFSFVDYLFPLGDQRRQAIHDKIASTFVVRADAVPDLEAPASGADAFGRPSV